MPETKPETEVQPADEQSPLRSYAEIHFAHDLLDSVAKDPEIRRNIRPKDPDSDLKSLIAARDALCWVLQHENPDFEDNLARLVKLMLQAGYVPRDITEHMERLEEILARKENPS